ncbi:MAG: 50S ribosomal protein L11 methyltransferase [Deltaproteobacteria bacterium]|nr:50S ribosomal protein L11 methyltransferase [Deltaproteobacteria bacterium]
MLTHASLVALLDRHAPYLPLALCPAVHAWQAHTELDAWEALEAAAGTRLPPPFYACAWPGSHALAAALERGVLNVRGQVVADVGCGSGVASVAAARQGAARVQALDVDPLAGAAALELARRHGVVLSARAGDVLADPALVGDARTILAGDFLYGSAAVDRGRDVVAAWKGQGRRVVIADAGRPFFRPDGLALAWEGEVECAGSIEGTTRRRVRIWEG